MQVSQTHLQEPDFGPVPFLTKHRIFFVCLLFGILGALADGLLDYFIYYEGSLKGLLFTNVPAHEVYIRTTIILIFTGFGFLLDRAFLRRVRVNQNLRQALEDNRLLMREMHHRVKNNLQVLASLVTLRARKTRDPECRKTLLNIRQRFESIALLHKRLHSDERMCEVNLASYLEELVTHIVCLQDDKTCSPIKIRTADVEKIMVPMSEAISCGLIVLELLSNAMEHGGEEISLTLSGDADTLRIVVSDQGPGLPPDFDIGSHANLGLQIVSRLVGQINARLDVCSNGGTEFAVIKERGA